jgi:hypothetical protein
MFDFSVDKIKNHSIKLKRQRTNSDLNSSNKHFFCKNDKVYLTALGKSEMENNFEKNTFFTKKKFIEKEKRW